MGSSLCPIVFVACCTESLLCVYPSMPLLMAYLAFSIDEFVIISVMSAYKVALGGQVRELWCMSDGW